MRPYIISGSDTLQDTTHLGNIIDSLSNIDVILYYAITERDLVFQGYGRYHEELLSINEKLVIKKIKLLLIFSSVPQDYYSLYEFSNIDIIHNPFYFVNHLLYNCKKDVWDIHSNEYHLGIFKKLFINLNRRPHYHRCMLIDNLEKYKLLDYSYYTWCEYSSEYENPYDFNFWKEELIRDGYNDNYYNCKSVLNKSPLISIVTESEVSHISFSEKVFKPLLIGMPFLVLGAKGFHKKLEEYGIELYTELFDYSFDDLDDLEQRVIGICENLNNLKDMDYNYLYDIIKTKAKRNRDYVLDSHTSKKFVHPKMFEIYKNYIVNNDSLKINIDELKTYLY